MTAHPRYPNVDKLTQELFAAMQEPQGFFYVSDGETFPTTDEFFERIRGRLEHGQDAVKKMKTFLRKYKQL